VVDKVANDFYIDVGFEQREANFAQRFLDIALGNPALALEPLEYSFEPIAKRVEHG
jgi:hypothetical protein